MRVPKFENIEGEAEFWDKIDTSELLRTGKQIKHVKRQSFLSQLK